MCISDFGGRIAISRCRSLSQSPGHTFFELSMIAIPVCHWNFHPDCRSSRDKNTFRFGCHITISGIDRSISRLRTASSAILISGCKSMSRLFRETFFDLDVVENFAFTARITTIHTLKRVNPISQHVRKI